MRAAGHGMFENGSCLRLRCVTLLVQNMHAQAHNTAHAKPCNLYRNPSDIVIRVLFLQQMCGHRPIPSHCPSHMHLRLFSREKEAAAQ